MTAIVQSYHGDVPTGGSSEVYEAGKPIELMGLQISNTTTAALRAEVLHYQARDETSYALIPELSIPDRDVLDFGPEGSYYLEPGDKIIVEGSDVGLRYHLHLKEVA